MPNPTTARHVAELVSRQLHRWQLERAAHGPATHDRVEHWPLITVSRECGSLGAEVGRRIAEQLDFECWDRELVQAMAEESGAQQALLEALDERARSAIEDFVDCALLGTGYTNSGYLGHLMRLAHTLIYHGRAVVIGRGVQFFAGESPVFRLRIVRPLEQRVAGIADREAIGLQQARAEIERIDRERVGFVKHHFDCDIRAAEYYDLTINTGAYDVVAAADVAIAGYRVKFGTLPLSKRPELPQHQAG